MRALGAQIALDLVERRLHAFEQLLHEMVVEVGHCLEQLRARRARRLLEFGGYRVAGLAVALEAAALHLSQIDVSAKLLGASDRHLLGHDVASVRTLQCRERAREVCSGAVHLIDDEKMRHAAAFEVVEERLRLHDARRIGFDDDDGGVDAADRRFRLAEEIDESGAIDDREVDVVGGCVRETDGRRLHVRDIFGLVIGHRRAIGDRAAAPDRAHVREHRFHQRGLARVMGTDEGNIT